MFGIEQVEQRQPQTLRNDDMSLTYADLFKYVVKKEDNKEPLSEFQEYYTMVQQNMHSKDYEKEQYLNMQLTILSRDKKYPTALPPGSSMYDHVKSSRLLADRAQNITLLAYHNADFHILIRHMSTNWNEYDSVFRLYPDWLPPPYLVPLDCFVTVTLQDTEQALKRRERILNKEIQKAIETYIILVTT
jgi:hypothetical protein